MTAYFTGKKNPAWEAGLYGLLLLSRVRFLRQRRGYAGLSLLLFPLFLLLIMIIVLLVWHLLASMSVYRCRILPPPVKTFFCAHVIEARLVPYIKKYSIYKCLYSLTGPTSGSCRALCNKSRQSVSIPGLEFMSVCCAKRLGRQSLFGRTHLLVCRF